MGKRMNPEQNQYIQMKWKKMRKGMECMECIEQNHYIYSETK